MGQPHSTVDEVKCGMVMLYYPLIWWTMQMKGYRSVREGVRVHVGQPHSTVDEVKCDMVMLYYLLSW